MNADHCQKNIRSVLFVRSVSNGGKEAGEYRFLIDKSLSLKVVIQANIIKTLLCHANLSKNKSTTNDFVDNTTRRSSLWDHNVEPNFP